MKRLFIAGVLVFSQTLLAEPELCFKTPAEYENIKIKLPKILQTIPLYLAWKTDSNAAAANVLFADGKLRFFFRLSHTFKTVNMEDNAKLCVVDNEIQMILPTATEKIELSGPTEITLRKALQLTQTTESKFKEVAAWIEKKEGPMPIKPSKAGVTN